MNPPNKALLICELIKAAVYEQDTDTRNTLLLKCIGLITGDQSFDVEAAERPKPLSKYHHEIKPGVHVDVYDVLAAWHVTNPALQHLIKKALQPGGRGHKTREQDLDDIVVSARRAREIEYCE